MKYFYFDTSAFTPKNIRKLGESIKVLIPNLDVSDVRSTALGWKYVGISATGALTTSDSNRGFHTKAVLLTELSQLGEPQVVTIPIEYKTDINSFEKLKELPLNTLVSILDARTLDQVITYLREEI